ncbi:hypothetical protein B0T16DRAFT_463363 [Cercophora newfieldiana]|uniref:Nephrocystin 3-like N-terminal domain-containing protein n=1 Tax=Cercophora newfieldiana TaxID=92897 RepID=A0AA39XT27_9PEZI|nr:hypothetical protein B0T16DRAFT_463363 [Cercophora newfieldiana]
MSPPSGPKQKVYRVRNLPFHADRHEIARLLAHSVGAQIQGKALLSDAHIHIHSLARSADPWEHLATKTATVSFDRDLGLENGDSRGSGMEWRIQVPGLRGALILDTHFEGFTPLNEPDQHSYDCIAISGLASHPFGSWQPHGNNKSFMWIRDVLPACLPTFRFLTFGYDTTLLDSKSFQTIPDLAARFILDMKSHGWSSPTSRPVVFLAHSLGGVLLKQVMVMLASSGGVETFMLGNIKGAIFFGVPSKGMDVAQLLAMTEGQPNQVLVSDLSVGSPYLTNLGLQFEGISELRRMKFFWAYETRQSPTTVKSPTDGSYSRTGPPIVLVSRDSATSGIYDSKPLSTFQIDEDHSGMVKFPEGDARTRVVAQNLREIVDSKEGVDASANAGISGFVNSMAVPGSTSGLSKGSLPSDTMSFTKSAVRRKFTTDVALRSIQAPEQNLRLGQIDAAHTHTFEWVYDKKSVGFTDWLRKGSGVFWISGKPGSGKSTMMKLITTDERTSQLTQSWGSASRKVAANFFFHHRGNVLQKSFEGLLRGIITQVVGKEPQLATILRQMLINEYLDHVNSEGLGDLPSDILELFNRYNLRYNDRVDRAVRRLMGVKDASEQLRALLSTAFQGIDNLKREQMENSLLSERANLERAEATGALSTTVQYLCATTLQIDYSEAFRDLIEQWLLGMDLESLITGLLESSGLNVAKESQKGITGHVSAATVKRDVAKCVEREARREAIFENTTRLAWSRHNLETALSRILGQTMFDLDLILFLDALDEYDGRPEFIAEFLVSLTKKTSHRTSVRVCFASRPWPIFVEEFAKCPGFRIHEHTEGDIQAYCVDIMSPTLGPGLALSEIVPEIVKKSQGVFLWVRLVVEDLNSEAMLLGAEVSEARRVERLQRVLCSLPTELSDYYLAIIHRIPQTSRWDTYVLLECVSRAEGSLGLSVAFTSLQYSRCSSFKQPQAQLASRPLFPDDEFVQDVRTLSGGLVEVIHTGSLVAPNGPDFADTRARSRSLQFMHQTVQDFVQAPEFKRQVLGNSAYIMFENGHSFLFKTFFLGCLSRARSRIDIENAGFHATMAELTTGRSQYAIISDAPHSRFEGSRDVSRFPDSTASMQTTEWASWARQSVMCPLTFAAFFGLDLYIRDIPSVTPWLPERDLPFHSVVDALLGKYRTPEQALETAKALVRSGFFPTENEILLFVASSYTW